MSVQGSINSMISSVTNVKAIQTHLDNQKKEYELLQGNVFKESSDATLDKLNEPEFKKKYDKLNKKDKDLVITNMILNGYKQNQPERTEEEEKKLMDEYRSKISEQNKQTHPIEQRQQEIEKRKTGKSFIIDTINLYHQGYEYTYKGLDYTTKKRGE